MNTDTRPAVFTHRDNKACRPRNRGRFRRSVRIGWPEVHCNACTENRRNDQQCTETEIDSRHLFPRGRSHNGRFLRHRFSPKSKSVATPFSLPKRNYVAKEAVSAVWQTSPRQRSGQYGKPNDAPTTKPRPCVKTMLRERCATVDTPPLCGSPRSVLR